MPSVEIRLLGPFDVRIEGRALPDAGYQVAAFLLALLCAEPERRWSRLMLAGLLWPDAGPDQGRHRLREVLFRLRRAMGDAERPAPVIDGSRAELWATGVARVDLVRWATAWEQARAHAHSSLAGCPACLAELGAALNEVRGVLLEGSTPPPALADWLDERRRSLAAQWVEAAMALAEAGIEPLHNAERAVGWAPMNEGACRRWMIELHRAGRPERAVEAYERLAARLAERGAEPEDETEELYQQVLHREDVAPPTRATRAPPVPLTPCYGRSADTARLLEVLAEREVRLLTLSGLGGMGKTRLALQVAQQAQAGFPDGCVFVETHNPSSVAELAAAIARELGVRLGPLLPPEQQLGEWLGEQRLLLVLDEVDQPGPIAGFIGALLRAAPGLTLLVTSRVTLKLRLEHVYRVQGLSPEAAMTLWYDRARRADITFSPGPDARAEIAAWCARLGGHPLAIELAAASGGVSDLLTLSADFVDLPDGQRHLGDLLRRALSRTTPHDRRVIGDLTVFRGRFTAEDALRVAHARPETLHRLSELCLLDEGWHLHPLLREAAGPSSPEAVLLHTRWALELLDGPPDLRRVEDVLAAWDAALVAGLEAELVPRLDSLMTWIEAASSLTAGRLLLARTCEVAHLPSLIRGARARLGLLEYRTGSAPRGRQLLERTLGDGGSADELAATCRMLGHVCRNTGDVESARAVFSHGAMVAAEAGLVRRELACRDGLGAVALESGDLELAITILEANVALARSHGHVDLGQGSGVLLGFTFALQPTSWRRGISLLQQILREQHAAQAFSRFDTHNALGAAFWLGGDMPAARRHASACLRGYAAFGFDPGVVSAHLELAAIARSLGEDPAPCARDAARAARRCGSERARVEALAAIACAVPSQDLAATVHAGLPARSPLATRVVGPASGRVLRPEQVETLLAAWVV